MQIITGFCRFIPTVQAENRLYNGGRAVPCFLCKKDGVTLVCVTLNDRNDWNDHISLYDYAFESTGESTARTLTFVPIFRAWAVIRTA